MKGEKIEGKEVAKKAMIDKELKREALAAKGK